MRAEYTGAQMSLRLVSDGCQGNNVKKVGQGCWPPIALSLSTTSVSFLAANSMGLSQTGHQQPFRARRERHIRRRPMDALQAFQLGIKLLRRNSSLAAMVRTRVRSHSGIEATRSIHSNTFAIQVTEPANHPCGAAPFLQTFSGSRRAEVLVKGEAGSRTASNGAPTLSCVWLMPKW